MGNPEWLNELISVGDYSSPDITFPTLQLQLDYRPGTLIAFSGKLLVHRVQHAKDDRACIAWYMQDKIHKVMNAPQCSYLYVCASL